MAKAPYVDEKRFAHLLKVAQVSTESPERNVALLLVCYGTGMMLTEMATLPVSAYLKADGSRLLESWVAPELSYNGKARPLFWSNLRVSNAVDKYLDTRVAARHGVTTRKAAYRGLDPHSPLFLTGDGEPYRLIPRKTATGAVSYSCDSLSQLFRKLHLHAGVEGAGASAGRRTFAVNLHRKGFDLRHIHELLGHETLTATRNLINADPVRLGAIAAGVF